MLNLVRLWPYIYINIHTFRLHTFKVNSLGPTSSFNSPLLSNIKTLMALLYPFNKWNLNFWFWITLSMVKKTTNLLTWKGPFLLPQNYILRLRYIYASLVRTGTWSVTQSICWLSWKGERREAYRLAPVLNPDIMILHETLAITEIPFKWPQKLNDSSWFSLEHLAFPFCAWLSAESWGFSCKSRWKHHIS